MAVFLSLLPELDCTLSLISQLPSAMMKDFGALRWVILLAQTLVFMVVRNVISLSVCVLLLSPLVLIPA